MEHSPSLCVLLKMQQMSEALQCRPRQIVSAVTRGMKLEALGRATSNAWRLAMLHSSYWTDPEALGESGQHPVPTGVPSLHARSTHLAPVRVRRLAEFSYEMPTWEVWRGGRCW